MRVVPIQMARDAEIETVRSAGNGAIQASKVASLDQGITLKAIASDSQIGEGSSKTRHDLQNQIFS